MLFMGSVFFSLKSFLVSLDLPLWILNALFSRNKYKCDMHLRFFKEVRKASETVEALSLCYILHDISCDIFQGA